MSQTTETALKRLLKYSTARITAAATGHTGHGNSTFDCSTKTQHP